MSMWTPDPPFVNGPAGGTPWTADAANHVGGQYAAAVAYTNAHTPVMDTDYGSLDAALTATPAGGVLEIRGAWSKVLPLVVNKSMTLRFRGGSITQTTDTHGIDVTADNVTIENPALTGVGSAASGTGAAIRCVGTFASPRNGFKVRGGTIDSWQKYGVYLEQINDFEVSTATIKNISYGGIGVLSGNGGKILHNKITNITQPGAFVNSYGILLTRDSATNISTAPRTINVLVDGNTINGVPNWEGIDTHAGQNLTIVNNRVFNTNVGISIGGCPDEFGTQAYAPSGIIVTGNYIDSTVTDGSRSNGILLQGAGTTVGVFTEPAQGLIANNVIVGHGTQGALAGAGGIIAYYTRGAVIANNRIVQPGVAGVHLYHTNDNVLVSGNVVVDVWTQDITQAALIYVRSTNNTVTFAGNVLVADSKTATFVNRYGVLAATQTANVLVDGGGNNFTAATTAVISGVTGIVKMGFYGVAPIAKQTLAAAATDAATTQTLANSLRTALIALGLTS